MRSGPVELWLERRLLDPDARWRILSRLAASLPEEIREADQTLTLRQTDGFTGAGLKRCVEDARALYAYDCVRGREKQSGTAYLLEAVSGVKANRKRYAGALAARRS